MIALVHEVIRQGVGAGVVHRWALCGSLVESVLPRGATQVEAEDGRETGIDEAHGVFQRSGVYLARDQADRSVGKIVVNIDPDAARTEAGGSVAVGEWLGAAGPWTWMDSADASATLAGGLTFGEIGFWALCVVGALVLVEGWMARRFSHAYRKLYEGDGGTGGSSGALVSTLTGSMSGDEKTASIGAAR
jgi:hypothetical protein